MEFLGRGGIEKTPSMTKGNYERERRAQLRIIKISRRNKWWLLIQEDQCKLAWMRFRYYKTQTSLDLAMRYTR